MREVRCAICSELHNLAEMQIGYQWPDAYLAVPEAERQQRVRYTEDLCDVDGKTYFLRAVLEIPVRGESESFGWGIWVRVSQRDFRRYVALWRDEAQSKEPLFSGWVANQLPRYSQTLGVAVSVQLTNLRSRPSLTVVDRSHALGDEQRNGIFLERALDLIFPFLHEDASPVVVTGGWTLDSAADRFQRRDGVNWLPSNEQRNALQVGEHAKLLFRIEASDETGQPVEHVERMWVEVDRREATPAIAYTGRLVNHPRVRGLTRKGMQVTFSPDHVVDIGYADETLASERPDVLRCATHGPSQNTYLCQHLPAGEKLGFHRAEDPPNPRPDAWCDACDGEAVATVTVVCAGCYDAAEQHNR